MCEDEILFEEIKSKILKNFENAVLKFYEDLKTAKINIGDIDETMKNFKNSIKSFSVPDNDDADISFAQAHYQYLKSKE